MGMAGYQGFQLEVVQADLLGSGFWAAGIQTGIQIKGSGFTVSNNWLVGFLA